MSSVTNITGRPLRTARLTDSSTCLVIVSIDQLSANRRIGLEPMNAHVSIATPDSTAASMAPVMSAGWVRTATFGVIRSFAVSFASATTVSRACAEAPGRPMSALSMPSWSISCSSRILTSSGGLRTDGPWSPSRSVSSSSSTDR